MDNKPNDEKFIIHAGEPIGDADMEGVSGGAGHSDRHPMQCPSCKKNVPRCNLIGPGGDGLFECPECGYRGEMVNFLYHVVR